MRVVTSKLGYRSEFTSVSFKFGRIQNKSGQFTLVCTFIGRGKHCFRLKIKNKNLTESSNYGPIVGSRNVLFCVIGGDHIFYNGR